MGWDCIGQPPGDPYGNHTHGFRPNFHGLKFRRSKKYPEKYPAFGVDGKRAAKTQLDSIYGTHQSLECGDDVTDDFSFVAVAYLRRCSLI